MYKFIISIISLLPFVALADALPVKPEVQSVSELQNQEASIEEDFFPDIPLSLDGNILNNPNNLVLPDPEGQTRSPNIKPPEQIRENTKSDLLPEKESSIPDQTIKTEMFINPASRQEEKEYNFWKAKDSGIKIRKEYEVQPKTISRRKYHPVNDSLPTAIYISDYQKAVFQEIKDNNIEAVKALLDIIKNTEFRNGEADTPLLYAVRIGKVNMIAWLLARGADIKAVDINEQDVYHIARINNRLDILNLLHKYEI